jgi:hypothetical protein
MFVYQRVAGLLYEWYIIIFTKYSNPLMVCFNHSPWRTVEPVSGHYMLEHPQWMGLELAAGVERCEFRPHGNMETCRSNKKRQY